MGITDVPNADNGPQIVLGLVGAPGVAFSLARDLADAGLAEELARRLPGARWRVEVVESRLVQPPATDAAIVDAARRLLLDSGWDVVVCLTDLPLHIHRRPVVAHANPVHNVAIVSVPALGAMVARHRIREGIVRLVERLIGSHGRGPDTQGVVAPPRRLSVQRVRELGSDTAGGAFAFTARVLSGNLVLQHRDHGDGRPRRDRALCGAVSAGAGRRVLVCGVASFYQHRGPSGLYPGLLRTSLADLLFGDDWGALGAALETEDAVREAAYVRRSDKQTEKAETV